MPAAERLDRLDGQVAERGGALGRVAPRSARGTRASPRVWSRMNASSCAPSRIDDVHQGERERRVRAGQRGEVLVGLGGRARADRVDDDEVGAGLARLEHELPEVVVAGERVRAPQQDQLATARSASGSIVAFVPSERRSPLRARDGADRHQVVARAERRSTAARRSGPRAPGGSRASPSPGTARSPRRRARRRIAFSRSAISAERLVPGDPLEAALALGAGAAERMEQAVGRARVLEVARDLVAQRAAR